MDDIWDIIRKEFPLSRNYLTPVVINDHPLHRLWFKYMTTTLLVSIDMSPVSKGMMATHYWLFISNKCYDNRYGNLFDDKFWLIFTGILDNYFRKPSQCL